MTMRLRTKLLLLNLTVMGTTSVVLVTAVYLLVTYQMRQEIRGFQNDEFEEYALKYQSLLDDAAALDREMRQHFTQARMTYPIVCRVFDAQGHPVVQVQNVAGAPSIDAHVVALALSGREVHYERISREEGDPYWFRVGRILSPAGECFAFELGLNVKRLLRRIDRLRKYLLVTIPFVLLLSVGGAWWVTGRSLQPFGHLIGRLRQIRSASLYERLPVPRSADELHDLAEAVNEMLADIESAFLLVKEFTADAAHELRTPLTRLSMGLEGCLHGAPTPAEMREALDQAFVQCSTIRRLIDDLMLLARLDAGTIGEDATSCDLVEACADLEELWQTACEARGLSLEVSVERPLSVHGRPLLLRRLLVNLVDNALRHVSAGASIRVEGRLSGDEVQIRVSDTGPGIPREAMPRLFDRFYTRGGPDTPETDSTGLGLSICRKIAELHQGSIDVESKEGEGTTFLVRLPTQPSPATKGVNP